MVDVVEVRLKSFLFLDEARDFLVSLHKSLLLLFQLEEFVRLVFTGPIFLHEGVDSPKLVTLGLGATVEGTLGLILVSLEGDADEASGHLRNLLGRLLVVADEYLSEDLLHGRLDSLPVLDQVEGQGCSPVRHLHDLLDPPPLHLLELDLLQGHERDSLSQHPPVYEVLGDIMLCHDHVGKSTPSCLLKGNAVPLWLLHREESGESAEDGASIEVAIRAVVVELDQVADVLEPFRAEVALHLSLDLVDLARVFFHQTLDRGHPLLLQSVFEGLDLLRELGSFSLLLLGVGLFVAQLSLAVLCTLSFPPDFVLSRFLFGLDCLQVKLDTVDVLPKRDGLVFHLATALEDSDVLFGDAELFSLLREVGMV